jgi:hypothetical protein
MMTERELAALVALLNRTPMTPAEALWIQELIARLEAQIKQAKATP